MKMITRTTLVAATLAACTSSARAQEAAQNQNLTRPISTVEVGIGDVSKSSFKAGEYSGLQKKGGIGIGHFDWRGGAAYNADSGLRWRVKGMDLGLEGRNVYAEVGVQGKSRLTFAYDELLKNRSDSFQSIFDGAGTNVLTLPASWIVPTVAGSTAANSAMNVVSARGLVNGLGTLPYIDINTASASLGGVMRPTAAQASLVNTAADTDLGLFRDVNLATKRTRLDVAFAYSFDPKWGIDAAFRPEHRDGTKALGAISRATGGDIAAMIPDLIDTVDNQVNANLHFKSAKSFAQVGYTGSYFKNHVGSMTFQNWAIGPTGPITTTTMSSAPSNSFSQFHGTAGYHKSAATHLTATASYGRMTQNDQFLTDSSTPVVPVNSLSGLVVNTALNVKATTKPAKRLQLTGVYKFDNRDNQTAVHIYQFMDANQPLSANPSFPAGPNNPLGAVLATNAGANRSYSKKVNQASGDLDLKLAAWQSVKAGYEFQKIDRACPGSWIDCANAATTNENTGRADWRLAVREDVVVRVGYAYSSRRAPSYNENSFLALVPYAGVSPAAATGGATLYSYMLANGLNGWGPAAGYAATTGNANVFFPANSETHLSAYAWENRISELPGMRRYDVADRNRGKLRTSLDWQATDLLSFQFGWDGDRSDYPNSRYGVQDARTGAASFDATYALDEMSANVFYSYEDLRSSAAGNTFTANSNAAVVNGANGLSGHDHCAAYATLQQRNNNNKLDPCLDWTSDRRDLVHTVGLGLTKQAGPIVLEGYVVASRARSDNSPVGGNWVNNILTGPGAPATNVAAFFVPAAPLPAVTTDSTELRLNGRYAIGARTSVRLAYSYLRMQSDDYLYEGLQLGAGTIVNVLPTNERAFNHGVHIFGASYIFSF